VLIVRYAARRIAERGLRVSRLLGRVAILWAVAGLYVAHGTTTLRVGVLNTPPALFMSPTGQISGLLGELLQDIARREGWMLQPQACQWRVCLQKLRAGGLDLLPNVAYSPSRTHTLNLNKVTAYERWTRLFVRIGEPLDVMSAVAGKRVAVLDGSIQASRLGALLDEMGLSAVLVPVADLEAGFALVQAGQADAVLANDLFGAPAARTYGLEASPMVILPVQIHYAAAKGEHADILARIDHYLSAWQADPRSPYFELLARWGVSLEGPRTPDRHDHWPVDLALSGLLLALLAGLFLYRYRARRLIRSLALNAAKLDAARNEIDKQARLQVQMQQDAFQDHLTELPRRPVLISRVEQAIALASSGEALAAVLVFDVFGFGKINDTYGQDAADAVLREISQRLLAGTRPRDTVSRTAGDEFTVLLTTLGGARDTAERDAFNVAHALYQALRNEPVSVDCEKISLHMCVGFTMIAAQADAGMILQEAGIAVRAAEAAGGDQIVLFSPALQADITERLALERDLTLAIEQGGLSMHVQPQFDRSGQAGSAELLARWEHPRRGTVSPARFIPILANIGLILPFTLWTLEVACKALHSLSGTYTLSVNISPHCLLRPDFVDSVRAVIRETDAPAHRLIFEITEEAWLGDLDLAARKIFELSCLGIRFSLDDFGSGYTNLSYLRRLAIYELKIDRSQIAGLPDERDSRAIVHMILGMAGQLGLRVVAEGVETEAQADYLFQHGCDALQGYLYARPVPLDAWLAERHAAIEMSAP